MVILLVAILSAVAIPQFINFQVEAKDAATSSSIGALRVGIVNQAAQMALRCAAVAGAWPTALSLAANNITSGAGATCTVAQVPVSAERQFVGTPTLPGNPWGATKSSAVVDCTAGNCIQNDGLACGGAAYNAASDGWCYNPANGQIWANSANSTGPALEYTF